MTEKENLESNDPLVHILVLNWNNYDDSRRCIESLEKLDYPNYEIVLVDNGSTDRSSERLQDEFDSIRLVKTGENLGFAGGNNRGIQYSLQQGAELVWLLNNDTTVDKNSLTHLVNAISKPDAGLVGSLIFKMQNPDEVEVYGGGHVRFLTAQLLPNFNPDIKTGFDYVAGTSLLIKRKVAEEVGILDENFFMYWEDIEYTYRVKKKGYTVIYAPESKVYHSTHGSTKGRFSQREYLFAKGTVLFYKKHIWYWPVALAIAYTGKMINRLAAGDFKNMRTVTKGFWDGLKTKIT